MFILVKIYNTFKRKWRRKTLKIHGTVLYVSVFDLQFDSSSVQHRSSRDASFGAATTLFVLTAVGLPAKEASILVIVEWILYVKSVVQE